MKKYILIHIVFLSLVSSSIIGQNNYNKQLELDSGTINNQFEYILTKSTRWKEFQLIRKTSLLKLKNHVLDSINTINKNLVSSNQSTSQLNSKITVLEEEIATLKNEVSTMSEDKDSINLFGVLISKTKYNLLVWSIIIVLVLVLIFLLLKFKNNQIVNNRTKNELDKIESEHEAFRKKSLKKEQEIMRKLQDEINKNSY
jgi:septal ring factor EnvC (AmiA/AmiB activator)